MHERNSYSDGRGLFADKGQAKPTRDFVPRLKTDEPAQLEPEAKLVEAIADAKPAAGADGLLGGLIRRRTEPQQAAAGTDHAAAEEALLAEREAEEITRSVSEDIDNGMLYESLKLGLPLPKLGEAVAKSSGDLEEPKTFGEAALRRLARPTTRESSGTGSATHAASGTTERKRARKGQQASGRRQLTARLSISDFERFRDYAEESGRTYQDILSTATTSYLDEVAGEQPKHTEASGDDAKPTAPTSAPEPTSSPTNPIAVRSPYDWFGNS